MSTYILIVTNVDSPTYLYFFADRDQAIAKYAAVNYHGETHLFQAENGTVEEILPETNTTKPVILGREFLLPF